MMLIIARSFTLGSQIALKTPSVNNFRIEAPIGTDAKTRQFTTPQKLVNCGWMNAKIGRKLLHGHHPGKVVFGFCRHLFSNPRYFEAAQQHSRKRKILQRANGCYLKALLIATGAECTNESKTFRML